MPLWRTAARSTAFNRSVVSVSPGSSLACVPGVSAGWQHLSPVPVQLGGHLSLILYDETENDNNKSMTMQQLPMQ